MEKNSQVCQQGDKGFYEALIMMLTRVLQIYFEKGDYLKIEEGTIFKLI
jgi:hypothetical protein